MNNYAFIDWQNLYLWTSQDNWKIDLYKFRVFLRDKYKVKKAYYFIWYINDENNDLYTNIQDAWFILVFKKQIIEMGSSKKWNIDSDMIFHVMENLLERWNEFDKIILVTWDWDFKILVDYLIKKERFEKILFPNRDFASSLYKKLTFKRYYYLNNAKSHLEYTYKKRGS